MLSTWGGTRREDGCLTCVICRGNNKALPDAQASPLSATSLSLTAAVLGAIQPSLSFTVRSILEPFAVLRSLSKEYTLLLTIVFKKRKKARGFPHGDFPSTHFPLSVITWGSYSSLPPGGSLYV